MTGLQATERLRYWLPSDAMVWPTISPTDAQPSERLHSRRTDNNESRGEIVHEAIGRPIAGTSLARDVKGYDRDINPGQCK